MKHRNIQVNWRVTSSLLLTLLNIFAFLLVNIPAVKAQAEKIYWTEWAVGQKIQRANLDGTDREDFITTGLGRPQGIAVDANGGKVYWSDNGTVKIQRANLDGTNVEDLVTGLDGLTSPLGIALDVSGGKIYWVDYVIGQPGTGRIQRAKLDGTAVEANFITKLTVPVDVAGRDQLLIPFRLPRVANDAGKQPQDAAALLKVLHGAEAIMGSLEQTGMERVAVDDRLGVRRARSIGGQRTRSVA